MKRGPILTVLAVVVVAAALLALNLAGSTKTANQAEPSPPAAGATSAVPPPAPAAPPGNPPVQNQAAAIPFPAEAKYTGRTQDGSAAIAVTVRDNRVSAYLCDGKSVEGWYQGGVANGSIDAKGRGGNALSGSLSGDKLTGTVSANGRSWSYSAAPVAEPAGLYRAKSGSRTTGWIKDSSGQVTGLANDGGVVVPAPPLDTANAQYVSGGDVVVAQ